MENVFKIRSLMSLFYKWKWHISGVVVLAVIMSAFFSSSIFIKPKYKSKATLMPFNIKTLSNESETEQMLEIIQSDNIKLKIIDVFNLYERYGISQDDSKKLWKVLEYYDGNVTIQKNSNDAIQVSVLDEDPQIAADIIDTMICLYNKFTLELNIEKSLELLNIYKNDAERHLKEVDSLSKIINQYNKDHGMLDLSAQVEKYTEAISLGRNVDEARKILSNWQSYGAEYQKTDSLFYYALGDYHKSKSIYDNAFRDSRKMQTYCYVISKPYPADKKSYPIRSVIILFSALGALLAAAAVVVLIEKRKSN